MEYYFFKNRLTTVPLYKNCHNTENILYNMQTFGPKALALVPIGQGRSCVINNQAHYIMDNVNQCPRGIGRGHWLSSQKK